MMQYLNMSGCTLLRVASIRCVCVLHAVSSITATCSVRMAAAFLQMLVSYMHTKVLTVYVCAAQPCTVTQAVQFPPSHLLPLASMALRSCRVRLLGVSGANSSMTACTASMPVMSTWPSITHPQEKKTSVQSNKDIGGDTKGITCVGISTAAKLSANHSCDCTVTC